MAGSIFSYGGYPHPENEVNMVRYEVQNLRSRRGLFYAKRIRCHITGEIQETDKADLLTRINEIIAAYEFDGGTTSFTVDGTATPHVLGNNSMTGVRVVSRSWPSGDPCEWANSRNFAIILEDLQNYGGGAGAANEVLWWEETVRWVGTTGPLWKMVPSQDGTVEGERVFPRSSQKLIQEGSSMGWTGYVVPPGPLLPANLEHEDQRIVTPGTPIQQGNGNAYYPFRWRYVFETDTYTEQFPPPREAVIPF